MGEWIASTKSMEIFICVRSWLWPLQDWDLFPYFIYILCLTRYVLWNLFSYSAVVLCNIMTEINRNELRKFVKLWEWALRACFLLHAAPTAIHMMHLFWFQHCPDTTINFPLCSRSSYPSCLAYTSVWHKAVCWPNSQTVPWMGYLRQSFAHFCVRISKPWSWTSTRLTRG